MLEISTKIYCWTIVLETDTIFLIWNRYFWYIYFAEFCAFKVHQIRVYSQNVGRPSIQMSHLIKCVKFAWWLCGNRSFNKCRKWPIGLAFFLLTFPLVCLASSILVGVHISSFTNYSSKALLFFLDVLSWSKLFDVLHCFTMYHFSAHDNFGCQSCSQKQVVGIDKDLLPLRIKALINRYVIVFDLFK